MPSREGEPARASIDLVDGVRVVVPDTVRLITPYVLREQQDWFEDEIRFLRRLLQPGEKVIDIGANFGVYALSMARAVGPAGHVWAFEPASGTARFLAESIALNGFAQVSLERSALSSAVGTARLALNDNPELNALVHGPESAGACETVPLATLDASLERHGWRDIAFLKIDAEGEEANILKGGERFFAELSPLVQFEIRAGADWHLELVREFAARGYASYRLVPGLDALVAFDAGSPPDGYLLNLLCCKQDRAERLAARGFLVDAAASRGEALPQGAGRGGAYDWRNTVARLPYGARLAAVWEKTVSAGGSAEVEEALSLHAFSRDAARSASERFGALERSFGILRALCEGRPSHLRLASLARVARDYGARAVAVNALQRLGDALLRHRQVDVREPFLAPGERFDAVPPGEAIPNWVLAAVLEEWERLGSFSSFYTGASARPRLEAIRALGFGSAEMERRRQLLQERFGHAAA